MTSFDYVVVGGGTAGLLVAARLAEERSVTVCVLEAGEDLRDNLDIQVPGFAQRARLKSTDWAFTTIPQAVNNQPIYIPRGKGLGGSSSLNYSDTEVEAFGLEPDRELYGDGPIMTTLPRACAEYWPQFVKACEEIGLEYNKNAMSGNNIGLWPSANAIHPDTATRISSATAYYEPIKNQENLVVITGAQVSRIIFRDAALGDDHKAESVEYHKDDKIITISVKKEVILSAGSIQTPQILELSGIGDEKLLELHDIPSIIHLPGVGENLRRRFNPPNSDIFSSVETQEHHGTYLVNEINDNYESFDVLRDPVRAAQEWEFLYVFNLLCQQERRGMFATIPIQFGFVPLRILPEIDQIRKIASDLPMGDIHPASFKLFQEWLQGDLDRSSAIEIILVPYMMPTRERRDPDPGKKYISLILYLTHPFARGSVHINSADPLKPPSIDFSALDNPVDLAILKSGIKLGRQIFDAAALKDVVAQEILPGSSIQEDADIEDYIKRQVGTSFHPLGSAAMLPREEGGVVDANLKVYGTKNLRVVDASIIPIQIASHPMATIYAIAEKAADIIKLNTNEIGY
ncbi:hypothetical protein H0H81_004197 [Sphagnurus paluster]|uniref:Glucose-methanol-choline oxidoreductase N-terminal domain-containing protein n=1 Tax=Sphagnurus paluster TaxID=117069 RepID=A0A9P7GT22_9AGAR|nr:hypothetical protein H0H81_004197 [Sphagnurus paluster]